MKDVPQFPIQCPYSVQRGLVSSRFPTAGIRCGRAKNRVAAPFIGDTIAGGFEKTGWAKVSIPCVNAAIATSRDFGKKYIGQRPRSASEDGVLARMYSLKLQFFDCLIDLNNCKGQPAKASCFFEQIEYCSE